MATRVRPHDIGCEPSPSVPAETMLQDGWKTYLLFWAVRKPGDGPGKPDDLGVAVLDCRDCAMTRFGYPNDEGRPEHPLYAAGLGGAGTAVVEVLDSAWAAEVAAQRIASARRIWGGRGMEWGWARNRTHRHFVVLLKEATFECLASDLVVELFCPTFDEPYPHVLAEFKKH